MARDIAGLLRQQAALAAFGTYAFKETNLSLILNEAARICARSLDTRYCKICHFQPETNDLLIVAGCGFNEEIVGKVVSEANESSPQGRAFITREPVIVRNLVEENGYVAPAFYGEHKIISTVDVVIQTQCGPPFGVLEVDNDNQFTYDGHDIDFLTGFANVLAEAVATVDRNRVLRETLEHMQALVIEKDRLLEERNLLSQELQHRVRNNLQLVNDMLNAQLRDAETLGDRGIRGIMRRVMTLAQVYDHLLGVGLSDWLDFGAYVQLLCNKLPELQAAPGSTVKLICHAEKMILSLAMVTALGLIVAELVSNSYEHAFVDRGGTIEVSLKTDQTGQRGVIVVADDGKGYVAQPEVRRHGIGLVRRLVQQVSGVLNMMSGAGTTWTVSFPIESRA